MMLDTRDEAYQFFIQEAVDLLQHLEEGLLTLRQNPSIHQVHSLMRAAHSIKGGAACVGLTDIQTLAHHLENSFLALYREDNKIDQDLEQLLLQAYDCLRLPLLDQIQTGTCNADKFLEKVKPICAQLETKFGHSLEEAADFADVEAYNGTLLPEGDISQFLFTEEVAQGLNRWESLLADPQTTDLVEELKAQAEVFASIGQLLNLPGFVAIAQTALSALQINPVCAEAIGCLALADFREAQKAVLAGDRPGSSPSGQLVELAQRLHPTQKELKNSNGTHLKPSLESSLLEELQQASNQLATPAATPSESPLLEELEQAASQLTKHVPALPESSLLEDLEQASNQLPLLESDNAGRTDLSIWREGQGNHERRQADKEVIPLSTLPFSPLPLIPNHPESPHHPITPTTGVPLSVRVDLGRLELLNNLVGELVTQENAFLLQHQQYKETLEALTRWFNRFNQTASNLQNSAVRVVLPTQNSRQGGEEARSNSPYPLIPLSPCSSSQLQNLVQTVGEETAQVGEAIQDMALTYQQVQQISKKRQQSLKHLQTNLVQARMLPLADLLNPFPRMVRDLAIKNHKQVSLELSGANTMVDKAVLEKLYDPLVHLVRNAFDHGIEMPEVRQAQGKALQGRITIRAYHRGNHTYIEVQDDGRGIDSEKIRALAVALNWLSPLTADTVPNNLLYEYLFAPGFSTAEEVSELSGRGVGLDAVRLQVSALKGSINVISEFGKGTTFTLRLPFTLTVTKLLVFSINANLLAIPVDSLVAIANVPETEIEVHQGQQFYQWQGQTIPIYPQSLLSSYHYPWDSTSSAQLDAVLAGRSSLWNQSLKIPLLLISMGDQVIALEIEQILMEQDLVIKPFSKTIAPPSYLYGCTVLGNGRLVPVIDGSALVVRCQQLSHPAQATSLSMSSVRDRVRPVPKKLVPTVLVIDDSLTIRKTLALTLSKGGYQVIQARNGIDAIEQLRQQPGIHAAVCDIEMPQMNGFEFLSRCRQEFPSRSLPVIMLTSRSSERYRQLAKQLGATSYLTKPYLDKELLSTLETCLSS